MKVLHVISDRNVGGAGVLLCNLLRELPGLGVESLVALPEESLLCDRIRELGVRTVELRYPVDRVWLRSVGEVVRLLRAERPDLLHANAALSARISARLTGTPVVHTRHCYYPEEKETGALACFLNRRLSDLSIATAESAAENLRSLGIPRERIRCIPNGSNPVREVRREELSSFYAQAGLAESDLCIGICARLVPCKGHRCFLLAAHLLRQRLPELPLRFLCRKLP